MGIYVIAADGDANAVGLQYADKAVVVNITSEEDVLRVAREEQMCIRDRADGIVFVSAFWVCLCCQGLLGLFFFMNVYWGISVSYTHLDVYKRQLLNTSSTLRT